MVICLWLHEGRTSVVPTSNGKPTVDEISISLDYMLTKISIYFPYFRGRNWWARIHQSLVEEKPRQDHRCECSGGGHVVTPCNPSSHCEWGLYWIVGLGWEKCHSRGKMVRYRICSCLIQYLEFSALNSILFFKLWLSTRSTAYTHVSTGMRPVLA